MLVAVKAENVYDSLSLHVQINIDKCIAHALSKQRSSLPAIKMRPWGDQ